jgi:hypothetical protein
MGQERRKSPRRSLKREAAIYDPAGTLICACRVGDMSHTGGRLIVAEPAALPDKFLLLLAKTGSVRRHCQVKWRNSEEIGVQFTAR